MLEILHVNMHGGASIRLLMHTCASLTKIMFTHSRNIMISTEHTKLLTGYLSEPGRDTNTELINPKCGDTCQSMNSVRHVFTNLLLDLCYLNNAI